MSYYFGAPLTADPATQTEWLLRRALPDLLRYIGRNEIADRLRSTPEHSYPGRIARGESGLLKKLAVELESEYMDRYNLLPAEMGQAIWEAKLAGDERSGLSLVNRAGPVAVKHLRPSPAGLHAYRAAGWADAIAHADSRWPHLPDLTDLKADLTVELLVREPENLVHA